MGQYKLVLIAVLTWALTQHQIYTSPDGRVINQNTINRGLSSTQSGCVSMARSWAETFSRGKHPVELIPDGFMVRRPIAIGTETIILRCQQTK